MDTCVVYSTVMHRPYSVRSDTCTYVCMVYPTIRYIDRALRYSDIHTKSTVSTRTLYIPARYSVQSYARVHVKPTRVARRVLAPNQRSRRCCARTGGECPVRGLSVVVGRNPQALQSGWSTAQRAGRICMYADDMRYASKFITLRHLHD